MASQKLSPEELESPRPKIATGLPPRSRPSISSKRSSQAVEVRCSSAPVFQVGADSLAEFDSLVVGAPTWNTGADEQRTSTAWDDLFEEIDGLDLGGKPVAIFGLGDSSSYGDNFCDAIEEMHGHFASAGAKMVGYVSTDGYTFDDSKSVVDGQFLGLPLDED